MKESDVLVKINGKVHRLNKDNLQSIKTMAWEDRKQLIELLESIKQAEYVKADSQQESNIDAQNEHQEVVKTSSISRVKTSDAPRISKGLNNGIEVSKLDPKIKASDKDVDDLMARLILEQKQDSHHQSVPDKSAVIKLLLIVFVVILALAMIF